MVDFTNGGLEKAREKAKELNEPTLEKCLEHLQRHEKDGKVMELYNDFAPFSFYFIILKPGKIQSLNGGIMFHGTHDAGGIGCAPTFSVSIEPELRSHWEIHT